MTPAQRTYWEAESGYFEAITGLSGYLYRFSKDERRVKLQVRASGAARLRGAERQNGRCRGWAASPHPASRHWWPPNLPTKSLLLC